MSSAHSPGAILTIFNVNCGLNAGDGVHPCTIAWSARVTSNAPHCLVTATRYTHSLTETFGDHHPPRLTASAGARARQSQPGGGGVHVNHVTVVTNQASHTRECPVTLGGRMSSGHRYSRAGYLGTWRLLPHAPEPETHRECLGGSSFCHSKKPYEYRLHAPDRDRRTRWYLLPGKTTNGTNGADT